MATLPTPFKTLVVLPFEYKGAEPACQPLCDAFQETVTGILASAADLKLHFVIVSFAETHKQNVSTNSEALHRLGANLVVSGVVRSTATGFQISLVLTSTWRMRVWESRVVTVPRNIRAAELNQVLAEHLGLMLMKRPLIVSGCRRKMRMS